MKITRRQLRQLIKEAIDFSDREANPHDDSMYGHDIEDKDWMKLNTTAVTRMV